MSTNTAQGTNTSVVGAGFQCSRYWKTLSKSFMDAAVLKQDSTVYFNSTAYEITGNDMAIALGQFLAGVKDYGLTAKLIDFVPFIGVNYTSAKFNLINPLDTDAAHRLLEGGTPTYSGLGVTFNGSDNYLRSNLVPTNHGSYNNFAVGHYLLSAGTQGKYIYGVTQDTDKRITCSPNYNGSLMLCDLPGYSNRMMNTIPNGGIGLWQFWTNTKVNFNVDDIDQVGINPITSVTMPDIEFYLGANNSGAGANGFNASTLSVWYYGINFTSEDNSNLAILINELMINLKRIAV